MTLYRLILAAALVLPALAAAQTSAGGEASADERGRPLWEAGLAGGAGRVPDYPGSAQSHTRGIVLPMLIYRGPVLRIDQQGVRGRFFADPRWELDLSASAAFNARNNDVRQGMPELDYLFGVGPQLVYKGWEHRGLGPSMHLKLRAVMSTNFHRLHERGFTVDPELRWRFAAPWVAGSTLTASLQPTWASSALQRYFYEVTPAEATAARPAYAARAGYLGTETALTWSGHRSSSLSWFATVQVLSLRGAANEASPLLQRRSNLSIGAGLVWTPWHSAQLVP